MEIKYVKPTIEQIRISDRLGDLETNMDKVLTVTTFLLDEYGTFKDEQEAGEMNFEVIQIIGFIEIVFDYVHSTYEGLKDLQERL